MSEMLSQDLLNFIKISLEQGRSNEEIYKELLASGWTIDKIQQAFDAIQADARPKELKQQTQGRAVRIIVGLGVILVAAGVFSFIASNWQGMSKLFKISIIILGMLICYGSSWYLKEKLNYIRTATALLALGTIIYGAGIFLVAQMFNIRGSWPDGFILWMFGAVALAIATNSNALFSLGILVALGAVVGHPFVLFGGLSQPFILTSSFLLLLATIATFTVGWLIRKRIDFNSQEIY